MLRRIGIGLAVAAVVVAAATVALSTSRARGFLAAVFAPDGQSVYVIVRDVNATVVGLGYDTFTPPASVWVHRDRFRILNLRLTDGHVTVVREFPASPLEGAHFEAYHGGIFGSAAGHLRWGDRDHLEYELAVTRYDTPSSRTFVWRHRWSPTTGVTEDSSSWQPGNTGMSGDEPSQLSGDREVITARGEENLPCALVLLQRDAPRATALMEGGNCGSRYPDGYTREALSEQSRRAAIERSAMLKTTYADLVAKARARGLNEGAAMLDANKGMQRLGLYPKEPTIAARKVSCDAAGPVFRISDEEFRVGLFQDIQQAIDHPGEEVDFNGDYVTHRDFTTSRQLNDFLADRAHREFTVQGRGGCWHLSITRP